MFTNHHQKKNFIDCTNKPYKLFMGEVWCYYRMKWWKIYLDDIDDTYYTNVYVAHKKVRTWYASKHHH